MINRIVLLSIICLCSIGAGFSQSYKFRSYGQNHGIEQHFIYTLNQAQDGYMLVGTEDGLLKFNGVYFKKIDLLSKVENPGIITVSRHVEEAKIWYGFNDGRVVLLNLRDYTVIYDSILSNSSITGIVGDRDRNVWFSTANEGLVRIDRKLKVFTYDLAEYEDDLQINCLNLLPPSELILGTGNGLLSIDMGKMKRLTSIPRKEILGEWEERVTLLVRPKDSIGLYIGTREKGVWFYTGKKNGGGLKQIDLWRKNQNRNIKAIIEDKEDQLWISVEGEGLYKVSVSSDSSTLLHTLYDDANGLQSKSIRSLYCDKEGNIWIGHYGRGLSSFLDNFLEFYTIKIDDKLQGINSVIGIGQEMYLGLDDGLLRVNKDEWKDFEYVFQDHLSGKLITSLTRGYDESIWIGTESKGLYRWDPVQNTMERASISGDGPLQYINYLLPVKNGIWMGTKGGLRYVNYDYTGLVTYTIEDGMPSNNISCLYDDGEDIWIGYNISVVAHFREGKFEQHILSTGETTVNIVGISADIDGNIWAATEGKGIMRVTGSAPLTILKSSGLESNYCQGFLKDKYENFLVLHRGGISRIWNGLESIDILNEDNGIDGEFNRNGIYRDEDDNIWLGTNKGLVKYIPDNNAVQRQGPAIHLVSVHLGDRLIDFQKNIELPYGPHRLEIHYEAISFKSGKNIQYQYILEGFDDEWSDWTKNDNVVYRKLRDGKYRFRVRGCISKDACTTTLSLLNIDISPPIWKTWWFYILDVCALALIFWVLIKIRERNYKAKEVYLQGELQDRIKEVIRHEHELEVKNEQLEESIQQKETLLKEVHHRVKNNLQLVSSLLSLQARKVDDARLSEILQNSQRRISTMAALHKKLYSSNDIGNVRYQDYVENLTKVVSKAYETEACKVTLDINMGDVQFGIDVSVPLGLILNELITNCYKYAFIDRSEGNVKIDLLHLDGERYVLTIADNGIGMNEELDISNTSTLGLELVTVLTEQLNGNVKCMSTKKGTKFTITFNVMS
ncbi:MAG: hypothetical protein JKX74_06445 [Flavobacteriales bacterium]|nr:hypothetical protein [Flavobacteriales bacterium]